MTSEKSVPLRNPPRLSRAVVCLLLASGLGALSLQTLLRESTIATNLMSQRLWQQTVSALGGTYRQLADGHSAARVDLATLFLLQSIVAVCCWTVGAFWISSRTKKPLTRSLSRWGFYGWLWWFVPGAWELLRLIAFLAGLTGLEHLLLFTPQMWYSLMLAGWTATFLTMASRTADATISSKYAVRTADPTAADSRRVPKAVWLAAGLYAVVFTLMNWQLYRGLLLPHGDSAMYEEHLWNLTHGKGFRSYLDQGLFLGEHIQVVHLLLIPLHFIWPSQMLLELCESLALASAAIPVFWIGRRHTGSERVAALLAAAFLLYFPMQFLDIAIDLKTFRPISFGVPAMLFAIDQLERCRYPSAVALLLLALSAKEDFALLIAPLGIWIALAQVRFLRSSTPTTERQAINAQNSVRKSRRLRILGGSIAVFAAVYLIVATRVVIPWFRGGEEVHYARYFSKFGETLGEIAWNMLANPALLFDELVTAKTVVYALAILLPLGFLPLLSPGRLAVGLPLFGILCLNEIARDPRHHFHAPLVPIVFWAAAAGLGNFSTIWKQTLGRWGAWRSVDAAAVTSWTARFVCTSALATGLFFSLSPLGLTFWDPGSPWYWKHLYVPGKRAELFRKVLERIPAESCVASTDFVHPRFTHHRRSYDYSKYRRKVSGYQLQVPRDTDYIVIDTCHSYSEIKIPEQIREYKQSPEKWELLPDETEGYFIVLKRKKD